MCYSNVLGERARSKALLTAWLATAGNVARSIQLTSSTETRDDFRIGSTQHSCFLVSPQFYYNIPQAWLQLLRGLKQPDKQDL